MREFVKVYLCGSCIHYIWKKHQCSLGAHEEGKPTDTFFRDCPLGICIEPDEEPSSPIVTCGNCAKRKRCELYINNGNEKNYCSYAVLEQSWEEPEINPCRGCKDYDWNGGCKSNGGCGVDMNAPDINVSSKTNEVMES
jgi:hypothetical protein